MPSPKDNKLKAALAASLQLQQDYLLSSPQPSKKVTYSPQAIQKTLQKCSKTLDTFEKTLDNNSYALKQTSFANQEEKDLYYNNLDLQLSSIRNDILTKIKSIQEKKSDDSKKSINSLKHDDHFASLPQDIDLQIRQIVTRLNLLQTFIRIKRDIDTTLLQPPVSISPPPSPGSSQSSKSPGSSESSRTPASSTVHQPLLDAYTQQFEKYSPHSSTSFSEALPKDTLSPIDSAPTLLSQPSPKSSVTTPASSIGTTESFGTSNKPHLTSIQSDYFEQTKLAYQQLDDLEKKQKENPDSFTKHFYKKSHELAVTKFISAFEKDLTNINKQENCNIIFQENKKTIMDFKDKLIQADDSKIQNPYIKQTFFTPGIVKIMKIISQLEQIPTKQTTPILSSSTKQPFKNT